MFRRNEIERLTRTIVNDIRTRANNATLNALLGVPDDANGSLYARLGVFTAVENLKAILGDLSTAKRLGQIIGAFDEGADPQGDIFQALGVPATNSVWSAIKYIHDVAIGAPTAFSVAEILKVSGTEKLRDFIAKTGGTEIPAGEAIYDSIMHIVNTAVTGVGVADSIVNKLDLGAGFKPASDQFYTAARGPYLDILNTDLKYILTNAIPAPAVNSLARFIASGGTALGTVLADSKSIIDALGHTGAALLTSGIGAELRRGTGTQIPDNSGIYDYLRFDLAGKVQTKSKTIDLNTAVVGLNDLFTGTAQTVIVEKLIIKMPNAVAGAPVTGITIQTNHTTPQVFITAAQGAVANLIAENQLFTTDPISVEAGKKIQLTLAGGNNAAGYVCTVEVLYRAVTTGGSLT